MLGQYWQDKSRLTTALGRWNIPGTKRKQVGIKLISSLKIEKHETNTDYGYLLWYVKLVHVVVFVDVIFNSLPQQQCK